MAELKLSVEDAFERAQLECDRGNLELGKKIYAQLAQVLPDHHKLKSRAQDKLSALGSPRLSAQQKRGLMDLLSAGKFEEALVEAKSLAEICPEDWFIHNFLGAIFSQLNKHHEALACFDRAIELNPRNADCYANRVGILQRLERVDEALESCNHALLLDPKHVGALANRGAMLRRLARFDEALESYDRALECDGEHINGRFNRSLLLLLKGHFSLGWSDYEWRLKKNAGLTTSHSSDLWQGEDLEGRSIVLLAEQGLGDQIQFSRYAKTLSDMGAEVSLQCDPGLVPLMETCAGVGTVVAKGQGLPAADYHCPLLSVPGVLREDLSRPFESPFLFADKPRIAKWQKRLSDVDGVRIGASWQGSPEFKQDSLRSFPLEHFRPVGELEGVSLVSLQKGEKGVSQIEGFRKTCGIIDPEEMLQVDSDLMDAAAIMMNLNLVITSCTAIAHLGGALGVPTWVVLGKSADWRWFLNREDSPWYPSVRLFRQAKFGAWDDVFERISAAVQTEFLTT